MSIKTKIGFLDPSAVTTQKHKSRNPYSAGVQASRHDVGGYGTSFFSALPNPDLVLKKLGKRINDYQELMTDSQVYSSWQNRIAGVKALEYAINADEVDTEQSEFIKRVFANLKVPSLIDAVLEAVLYGVQFLEIYWQPQAGKSIPTALVAKPREWFVFNARNEPRLRSKTGSTEGEALWQRKWIIVQHNATYNNPYGEAILSRCYWPVQFKKNSWKFLMRFSEKLGTPFLSAKTQPGATDEEVDALYEDLDGLRQDGVIVTPDDVEIMILEASKGSGDLFAKIIQDCRVEITQAILSHTASTQATAGKLGEDHTALAVRDDIVKGDRQLVEDAMNQLIRWTIDANFFETSNYPTFQLIEQQALDKGRAERDDMLTKNKQVRFTKPYYRRHYGFEEDEIEIIEEQPTAQNAQATAQSSTPAQATPQAAPQSQFEEPSSEAADKLALNLVVQNLMQSPESIGAMKSFQEQLVKAISKGSTYEEVDAMLAPLVGKVETTDLENVLANALFAADAIARLQVNKETKQALSEDENFAEPPQSLWLLVAPTRITAFSERKRKTKEYPPPANAVQWNALKTMNEEALRRRGLLAWSNEEGDPARGLMLFPRSWYNAIPDGYALVDIFGKSQSFKRGSTDDDARFGCLAYGVIASERSAQNKRSMA